MDSDIGIRMIAKLPVTPGPTFNLKLITVIRRSDWHWQIGEPGWAWPGHANDQTIKKGSEFWADSDYVRQRVIFRVGPKWCFITTGPDN